MDLLTRLWAHENAAKTPVNQTRIFDFSLQAIIHYTTQTDSEDPASYRLIAMCIIRKEKFKNVSLSTLMEEWATHMIE